MDAVSHMKWFRQQHEMMSSGGVRDLTDFEFRVLSAMMSLASQSPPQDRIEGALTANPSGKPLPMRAIHVETWTSPDEETTQGAVDSLAAQGFVEQRGNGAWRVRMWWRQYANDTSTQRVQKHRARQQDGGASGPPPNNPGLGASAVRVPHARFEEFWRRFDYRVKKKDAIVAFNEVVEAGADVDVILTKVDEYNDWLTDRDGMKAQAANWLRDERWNDEYFDDP